MSQAWRSQIKKKKDLLVKHFSVLALLSSWGRITRDGGLSCALRMFSSIPGLYPLNVSARQIDNQPWCVQMLPNIPWGPTGSPAENHWFGRYPPVHTILEDFRAGQQSQEGAGTPSGTKVLGADGNIGASSRRYGFSGARWHTLLNLWLRSLECSLQQMGTSSSLWAKTEIRCTKGKS